MAKDWNIIAKQMFGYSIDEVNEMVLKLKKLEEEEKKLIEENKKLREEYQVS